MYNWFIGSCARYHESTAVHISVPLLPAMFLNTAPATSTTFPFPNEAEDNKTLRTNCMFYMKSN